MKKATLLFRPISYGMKGSEPAENRISRWLVGVSVIVLLVACSNVTNLLLARAVRRRREVAVRLALGVSRARLLRLFLIESLILSGIGAAAGLGVAFASGTFMRKTLLPDIEWSSSTLDGRVVFVLLVVTLAVAMTIGLVPAWGSNRTNLGNALKSGVRDGGGNRSGIRTTLAIMQTGLSVILLVGAGLFVKSLYNVRGIDLGVETSRVVNTSLRWTPMVTTTSSEARAMESRRRAALYPQLLERVQTLPEVQEASLTVGLAFEAVMSYSIRVPGWDTLPKISSGAPSVSAVSANYFRTTGTRILRGRAFTAADRVGSEPVVIVSQTMAKTLWPKQDALGSCFYASSDSLAACARIIGVSADVHRFELREDPSMHFYLPWGQGLGTSATTLLIRPRGDQAAAIAAVRRAVQELDPTVSYVSARSLQDSIEPQVRPWKLGANIFALMGALAICVAAVGLYSVMSYFVAQRRQEIGVRMALGAQSSDILQLIMRSGVGTAAIGIALGVVVSLTAGRFIEPLLFETSSRDTLVFTVVVSSLLGVSVLASLVPALRARRVNLLEALRTE